MCFLFKISNTLVVPSLHGVHLPQDSCTKNSATFLHSLGMDTDSPTAITVQLPNPTLNFFRFSFVRTSLSL